MFLCFKLRASVGKDFKLNHTIVVPIKPKKMDHPPDVTVLIEPQCKGVPVCDQKPLANIEFGAIH